MKISGIDIGEYRQFKNIKFDFTYPEGHEKAGQPLEKVCFIGQSGTGKTTLLNVIWDFFQIVDAGNHLSKTGEFNSSFSPFKTFENSINIQIEINQKRASFSDNSLKGEPVGSAFLHWGQNNKLIEDIRLFKNWFCLFIKESIAREADAFLFDQKEQPQIFSDFIKTDTQIEKEKAAFYERLRSARESKVIALGDMQSLLIWQYLLKDINEYDEATVAQITNIIQNTPKNKVAEALQKWVESDPRIKLAEECLNPILNEFFLEVDDSEKGKVPITLRTRQGVKIDSSYLSTGTRQLLSTAIPLYKFDTTDTVILFDEPERSLFPDIQRKLIKYYTSLAPKAQFFFATHSPIIASAFEPCERFILYFDDDGEVKCRNGVAPIGDDPNDILSEDFGLQELMLDEGLEAYQKYRQLGSMIRQEADEQRKNELIAERIELGNRYNF